MDGDHDAEGPPQVGWQDLGAEQQVVEVENNLGEVANLLEPGIAALQNQHAAILFAPAAAPAFPPAPQAVAPAPPPAAAAAAAVAAAAGEDADEIPEIPWPHQDGFFMDDWLAPDPPGNPLGGWIEANPMPPPLHFPPHLLPPGVATAAFDDTDDDDDDDDSGPVGALQAALDGPLGPVPPPIYVVQGIEAADPAIVNQDIVALLEEGQQNLQSLQNIWTHGPFKRRFRRARRGRRVDCLLRQSMVQLMKNPDLSYLERVLEREVPRTVFYDLLHSVLYSKECR